jgi:hypothetical protein
MKAGFCEFCVDLVCRYCTFCSCQKESGSRWYQRIRTKKSF